MTTCTVRSRTNERRTVAAPGRAHDTCAFVARTNIARIAGLLVGDGLIMWKFPRLMRIGHRSRMTAAVRAWSPGRQTSSIAWNCLMWHFFRFRAKYAGPAGVPRVIRSWYFDVEFVPQSDDRDLTLTLFSSRPPPLPLVSPVSSRFRATVAFNSASATTGRGTSGYCRRHRRIDRLSELSKRNRNVS